jgi:hypothetical protein
MPAAHQRREQVFIIRRRRVLISTVTAMRADPLANLQELLAQEPFTKAKKMRFSRITQFNPVQHQPVLRDWFVER